MIVEPVRFVRRHRINQLGPKFNQPGQRIKRAAMDFVPQMVDQLRQTDRSFAQQIKCLTTILSAEQVNRQARGSRTYLAGPNDYPPCFQAPTLRWAAILLCLLRFEVGVPVVVESCA